MRYNHKALIMLKWFKMNSNRSPLSIIRNKSATGKQLRKYLKDCPWWRLYDQTRWQFLHSEPSIHWPSTHARTTGQWPLTTLTHTIIITTLTFFETYTPAITWRCSRDPTQQKNIIALYRRWTGAYAMMLRHSQTRSAEFSWVMPLLTYSTDPAELNVTV